MRLNFFCNVMGNFWGGADIFRGALHAHGPTSCICIPLLSLVLNENHNEEVV